MKLKLLAKFNAVMLAAFLFGLLVTGIFSYLQVEGEAKRDVLHQAALIAGQGHALSRFTKQEIVPLLSASSNSQFLPQSSPFWTVKTVFSGVQEEFPDYSYRAVALNPTAPADLAVDWEADLINSFKKDAKLTKQVVKRMTPAGLVMSVATPIRADEKCLRCHSTPSAAPASMVKYYGDKGGFGWVANDVVGAQIVSVPMKLPLEHAQRTFFLFLAVLTVVFLAMMGLINLLLYEVIIKPTRAIATIADKISRGDLDTAEYEVKGDDEIASLGRSFNRMHRSLVNAMKMLGE